MNIHTLADIELHIGRLGHRVDALCKFYTPGHNQLTHGRRKGNLKFAEIINGFTDFNRLLPFGRTRQSTRDKRMREVVGWALPRFGPWREQFIEDVPGAWWDTQLYRNEAHLAHNPRLRGESISKSALKRSLSSEASSKRFEKLLRKAEITDDTVLYRGIKVPRNVLDKMNTGDTISDKGFVSTSLVKDTALPFSFGLSTKKRFAEPALMRIEAEKGTFGGFINSLPTAGDLLDGTGFEQFGGTNEIVIPPRAKFLVTGISEIEVPDFSKAITHLRSSPFVRLDDIKVPNITISQIDLKLLK